MEQVGAYLKQRMGFEHIGRLQVCCRVKSVVSTSFGTTPMRPMFMAKEAYAAYASGKSALCSCQKRLTNRLAQGGVVSYVRELQEHLGSDPQALQEHSQFRGINYVFDNRLQPAASSYLLHHTPGSSYLLHHVTPYSIHRTS